MLNEIVHIGVTVSDMDASISFYRDILGLSFKGEILMEGPETEMLFNRRGCRARVAYLNGSEDIAAPPVELIQFLDEESEKQQCLLFRTCISEICFKVQDIESVYSRLSAAGVECLSRPQSFDFSSSGFGRSKAIYFRDPDGIILELMEYF